MLDYRAKTYPLIKGVGHQFACTNFTQTVYENRFYRLNENVNLELSLEELCDKTFLCYSEKLG